LNLANASIQNNEKQFQKRLKAVRVSGEKPMMIPCKNLEQEAEVICQQILDYRDQGIELQNQAVLFRSRHHALQLEQELVENKIPYDLRAGVRFFEQAHIKDLLAYLAIIINQRDQIQWIRILTMHPGLSNISAQKIIEILFQEENPLVKFVFSNLKELLAGRRIRKVAIQHLIKLQNIYRENVMEKSSKSIKPTEMQPSLPDLMECFSNYLTTFIKDKYHKNWEDRLRDLQELQNFAIKYRNIRNFLADVLTQYAIRGESTQKRNSNQEEKPLILSTIHQAKGLEWDVVFVINLLEGRFPHSRSMEDKDELEEERRLFYVACTRAKDHLILTYPLFVWRYNYNHISGKSRFIEEIDEKEVFDEFYIEEE
jgi:DNA helicase-2/ATP-dependent DNA helicase PcrA